MPARKPEELDVLFVQAFNAGDIEAMMQLYEPAASLTPQPGQIVFGTKALREALSGFVARKPRMTLEARTLAEAGGIALTTSKWVLESTGPDGKPMKAEGQSAEVARRQPDGTWLFVIDNPHGLH